MNTDVASHLLKQHLHIRLHRHINQVGPIHAFPGMMNCAVNKITQQCLLRLKNQTNCPSMQPFPTSSSAPGDSGPFGNCAGPCGSSSHWGNYQQIMEGLTIMGSKKNWQNCLKSFPIYVYSICRGLQLNSGAGQMWGGAEPAGPRVWDPWYVYIYIYIWWSKPASPPPAPISVPGTAEGSFPGQPDVTQSLKQVVAQQCFLQHNNSHFQPGQNRSLPPSLPPAKRPLLPHLLLVQLNRVPAVIVLQLTQQVHAEERDKPSE